MILIGGGSRSGKSRAALEMLKAAGSRQGFIATAQAWDDEMRERIARHKEERDSGIVTWEEPLQVAERIAVEDGRYDAIVVDCLTLWLSNLMLADTCSIENESVKLVDVCARAQTKVILVTNEVGCGIVPDNALARRFRDYAGKLHQMAAQQAAESSLDDVRHRDENQVIGRLLAAIQFLTVIPIPWGTGSPGAGAVWFPLVGAVLGASAGIVLIVSRSGLGLSIGGLLALVWLLILTGCLHEDGLADVADAVRAGRSRQKMMEILKDSRIGTYGAVALVVSIAVRWQALARSPVNPIAGLAAAIALSRTSLVALAGLTPPVGTGIGQAFATSFSGAAMLATLVESILIVGAMAYFVGWRTGAAMIVSSAGIVLLARLWFMRRLGGVNGDCLGATCQVVEMVNLLILACQPFI